LNDDSLYFDCNGSTPVHPLVADAAVEFLRSTFGNPGASHAAGLAAQAALADARREVAEALGARPEEVVFTSGGTESDNHAIRGVLEAESEEQPGLGHIIVGRHEHGAVLRPVEWLERRGHPVTWLNPDAGGRIRVDDVATALRPDTRLVSLMFANNETGVLQPVHEVGRLLADHPAYFLVDAVCGVGKARVHFDELGCDLLALGGHKLQAPKGIGALLVREHVRLAPLMLGCGQQGGRRSGTENTLGAVALGRALRCMREGSFGSLDEITRLTDLLWRGIQERCPAARRNGAGPFLGNTLNVWFPGVPALELQARLSAFGASIASGASATTGAPSHVLVAMDLPRERALESVRLSLGHETTEAAVLRLLDLLSECLPASLPVRALAASHRD